MSNSTINIDDLAAEIAKILGSYGTKIQEETNKKAEEIATKTAEILKETSPQRTGDYAKGWDTTTNKKTRSEVNCVVHNKTDWQLTHLLEKSHILRNGKRSKAQKHIKPAETQAIKDFEKAVEEVIQNANV
jgi:hypothetical protein